MKKTLILMILMMAMVGAFATPRLESNKIYLDEAVTSMFTSEEFIANVGGEEALDIPDEVGNTKRMQFEIFCNPNKIIEFETEELAAEYYNAIMEANLQPEDLYVSILNSYENLDFWLFMTFFDKYEYCPETTPTYVYAGDLN